jgi:hypothetical protein
LIEWLGLFFLFKVGRAKNKELTKHEDRNGYQKQQDNYPAFGAIVYAIPKSLAKAKKNNNANSNRHANAKLA